jgi:7-cyano-7-deazaguanine synthase
MNKKGILLSGGIDSVALAFWKRPQTAYTIDYGQRPAKTEIRVASQICKSLDIEHHIISVDCSSLGSGDLSENKALKIAPSSEWWPFRNQLLITLACMRGATEDLSELMIGSVKTDGFHKDGTSDFFQRINELVHYQEGGITVTCPSVSLTSKGLVEISKIPLELLLWAHSCHTSNIPCGFCSGCLKYLLVREELNIE